MNTAEKVLLSLDRLPMAAVYRVGIGILLVPALNLLRLDASSAKVLTIALLFVLFSLRIGPLVLRKLLPLSSAAKAVWYERRQIAKSYDSYQWQKLFFIGLGLISYEIALGERVLAAIVVASFCLITGAIGLAVWNTHRPHVRKTLVHEYAM